MAPAWVGEHEEPGRTRRVQKCPGILGLEQGIQAQIALPLPAVPCSENFCQLLVWRTGALRRFSGLLEDVCLDGAQGWALGWCRCSPLPVAHQDCRSPRQ